MSIQPHDDRRHDRHSIRQQAKLEPLDEACDLEQIFHVTLQDLSRSGAKLLSDRPLRPNTTWRLRIIDKSLAIASLPVRICYCKTLKDGVYHLGAQVMIEPFVLAALGIDPAACETDDDATAFAAAFDGPESVTS